ncbi:MAG: hypothetical protein V2I46_09945 [Bacteroides sp.]|jgi:hypothetical protein|nr:hypothetical protein [Bacteroides sp.]
MKNLKIYFFIIALLMVVSAQAQNRFIVQNGTTTEIFSTFAQALAGSEAGDTLYMPGGTFPIGNVYIDHTLTLIGTGHYPDYTAATGVTWLDGNIYLRAGADNSFLQGFYLTGSINIGSSAANQAVNFLTISRCNIENIKLYYYTPATAEQIHILENVIRNTIIGGNAQYVLIEKNIVHNISQFSDNTMITNNIVLKESSDTFNGLYSCLIQNNIFLHTGSYFFYNSTSNTLLNNLFVREFVMPGNNTGSGNIGGQALSSIFVNVEGSVFGYEYDYHLQAGSPGVNGGTDGNDIGIYGTTIPYKEGAIPFNPSITFEQVSPLVNEEGNIEVEVNVSAQER